MAVCKQRATHQIDSDHESLEQLTTEELHGLDRTKIYVNMRMMNSGKSVKFHIDKESSEHLYQNVRQSC